MGPRDYRRILSVIDNNAGAGEKNMMMDLNSNALTDSVKQSFKIINQQVISVFSLQGGVGKTTLAFNLAFYLKDLCKLKILVIDLNFSEGKSDLSLALGLPETPNLSCYIERITDDYDAFLGSILSLKKFNIDFIQPPLSIFQSDKFGVDMLDNLIYHARNEYNFIIADIPYRYDNISLEMLNLSTVLIFLMFPSPGAFGRIESLKRLLQGTQKKGIIINNVFGLSDFYSDAIIDDLEIPVLCSIPFIGNEKKNFLRAGKLRTGILDLQKEMPGLAGKVLQ
ncbi:MAG: ParA family protein [Actinobacteria bacterium]|nr:ParA family protein [Actinomycetota bacterium]